MATAFHAELVTPERVLFSGDADEVSLRTDVGEAAFLAHHEELVAALDITVVRIRALEGRSSGEGAEAGGGEPGGDEIRFTAHGGFVQVADNKVTILAGVAERGDEIDVDRARRALGSARERLGEEGPVTSPEGPLGGARLALLAPASAEAALRRAEIRLEAAGAAQNEP